MAEKSKLKVGWSIKNLDTGEIFQPQFPMSDDGINVTIGGNISEQSRFGIQDPIIQWTGGRQRSISFSAILYASYKDESFEVKVLLDQLESLAVYDDDLRRPPICLFSFGEAFSETVLIESIDPNIVSVEPFSGYPREVRLTINMKRYVPFSQKRIDPSKPSKESFHLIASRAEQSYEAIARRYYGDPLMGDRLRKRHPDMPFAPEVGSTVNVPSKSLILQEVVEPAFHAFSFTDEDATDALSAIIEDRNSRKLIVVT